jgi:predicted helicase
MNIDEYVESLDRRFQSGNATEHSYRGDLQQFLESRLPDVQVTNEPKRISCGAPDYILTKQHIPVGYIEAKDIGARLDDRAYDDQFNRYRASLPNLIITDYLDFWFYLDGELIKKVRIAKVDGGEVVATPGNFDALKSMLSEFLAFHGQTISSASTLAKMMAGKARLMSTILAQAVEEDIEAGRESDLYQQLAAFKSILIHDIDAGEFADIYSQTIAYGMFAARLHDESLDNFSRQEAAELIPKSNPFLRKLFHNIAGPDLDQRIDWLVEALVDIFRATDVSKILDHYRHGAKQKDPFLHFYETFLAEYDPSLRKSRGVWYTPEPVVRFMVRSVDTILRKSFGIDEGLAASETTEIVVSTHRRDKRFKNKQRTQRVETHKVQILDPATGTGTFIAEVVRQVFCTFEGQEGIWPDYVENDLIPRIHGFEILMAPYAMAHLKLELLLEETGFSSKKSKRLGVYLTDSLEECHPDTGTLFASWLSNEASEANHIKRDCPVMVVLGNPPYSGVSSNMGEWIVDLIETYKYVDGEHFGERKHWLHDDYVKFIRFGQYFVERNGGGVLAYINNHSFLENPTFRGMRWSLLNAFDEIYILDLHGNSKKKEVSPDGTPDKNVFDIQQGVSINFFVKNGTKKKGSLGRIFYADLWGSRSKKYDFLKTSGFDDVNFEQVDAKAPYYLFVHRDFSGLEEYEKGFSVAKLFETQSMGVTSARDAFAIDFTAEELSARASEFYDKNLSTDDFQRRYSLKENYQWKVEEQRAKSPKFDPRFIQEICYRPFDKRVICYQDNLVFRARRAVMENIRDGNIALACVKLGRKADAHNYLVTDGITDKSITSSLDNSNVFPLFVSNTEGGQRRLDKKDEPSPNFSPDMIDEVRSSLGIPFEINPQTGQEAFGPYDIFDYIYAVLYSPIYREKNKELLRMDFPRIPFPGDRNVFWRLVECGTELRNLHLMKSDKLRSLITNYPIAGDNKVTRKIVKKDFVLESPEIRTGSVWINDSQYFKGVPHAAWEFSLGGYKPAQKWLKDRVGRTLSRSEITHYQRVVVALMETKYVMTQIDLVICGDSLGN